MRSIHAALFASILAIAGPARSSAADAAPAAAGTRIDLQISFKLDPRLSGPTYGGERWISPRVYSGAAAQDTVHARAFAVDRVGRSVPVAAQWATSDPDLVTVSPRPGEQVAIVAKRVGEATVTVTHAGVARKLTVTAAERGGVLLVRIAQ
ncbi:MAG TPA: hypothetical protein VFL83_18490 [Anaeromyxobacter sp.]|nr:hypothetical protein [Anaeromyxobacter sp.]